MTWTQSYNPTGSEILSTLAAAAPVVVLLGTLALAGWSASRAAAAGLLTALVVAIGIYGMPWQSAIAAAGYGACFGMFPIGWIVFTAVFLYILTVEAGAFETVKASVVAISPDRRLQALLIAFGFGAFLGGAAGFGTPVAISGAAYGCRLSAALRGRTYTDREHRARCIWRPGHADYHTGEGNRVARRCSCLPSLDGSSRCSL